MKPRSAPLGASTQPQETEPLLPSRGPDALAVRTRAVVESSHRLQGMAQASMRQTLRALVRAMDAASSCS